MIYLKTLHYPKQMIWFAAYRFKCVKIKSPLIDKIYSSPHEFWILTNGTMEKDSLLQGETMTLKYNDGMFIRWSVLYYVLL